jgi:hypothetical protein
MIADGLDPGRRSAVWQDDGTIVFVYDGVRVGRISPEGGPLRPIGSVDLWRRFNIWTMSPLPGCRGFLYTRCPGNCVARFERDGL